MPSDTANERPQEWGVVDLNATALKPGTDEIIPRVHEVAPGKQFKLTATAETFMEERFARLFLKDAAFVVRDRDGNVVKALTEEQLSRVMPQEKLAANLVIADLSELTDAALRDRAMVHPRSNELPPSADRGTLIDFLEGIFQIGMRPRRGNDDAIREIEGDMDVGADPAAEAARILGDG